MESTENSAVSQQWRQRTLTWLAVAALAATVCFQLRGIVTPQARAANLLAEMGGELQPRPLVESELGIVLQAHPQSAQGNAAQTLRTFTAQPGVVLLHFWASWCTPCLAELPDLVHLAQTMRGRKFQLIAVSYDDNWQDHDAALQKALGDTAPTGIWLRDPQGQSGDAGKMLRTQLGTEQLPETYVIAEGKLVARLIAGQQWTGTRMQRALQQLANEKNGAEAKGE